MSESQNSELECLTARVAALEAAMARMREAYPRNTLALPDYDGHRVAHEDMIDAEKVVNGYKAESTKNVIGWGIAGLLTLIATGAVEHIKAWLK